MVLLPIDTAWLGVERALPLGGNQPLSSVGAEGIACGKIAFNVAAQHFPFGEKRRAALGGVGISDSVNKAREDSCWTQHEQLKEWSREFSLKPRSVVYHG